MARRHGIKVSAPPSGSKTFERFIHTWQGVTVCLKDPTDFEMAVLELGRRAHRHHIRYLEVLFSPEPFVRRLGISYDDILCGMNQGRMEALRRWNVHMRWIVDGVRDSSTGLASVERAVEWMLTLRGDTHGVVALGLGGRELGWPCERFADAFRVARNAGFRAVAHAGETDGPQSVWNALEALGAERIGHGVRSIEDPVLIEHLVRRRITLEVCPRSNLCTGAVTSSRVHPIAQLYRAGVPLTLASDDPGIFATTLTAEYRFAARRLGLAALERVLWDSVEACFLPPAEKSVLRGHLMEALATWRGLHATDP